MEMRTVIGITVLVAVLVVSYTIFTDGYGPVEEAVFELIKIPDRDPTPSQIQGAERIREVFNTYGDLQSALQDADQHEFEGDERACWTTHKPLKHLHADERGSLTIRYKQDGEGSRLELLRGNTSSGKVEVLKETTFNIKPCVLNDEMAKIGEALDGCSTCIFDSPSKSPLSPSVAKNIEPQITEGFLWSSPTQVLLPNKEGSEVPGAPNVGPDVGEDVVSKSYTLPDGQEKYYVFRFGDAACFMPSGDALLWGVSNTKLNEDAYQRLSQQLDDSRQCNA